MNYIKLHIIRSMHSTDVAETQFDPADICGIRGTKADDTRDYTYFHLTSTGQQYHCQESPNELRQLIETAKKMENIQLNAEAATLILHAHGSTGRLYFIEGSGLLGAMAGEFKTEWLGGRDRTPYDRAKRQLVDQDLVITEGGGNYRLNDRGYAIGDFLAAREGGHAPFQDCVTLPSPKSSGTIGFQFNQNNYNAGDVNNIISERGDANQSINRADSTSNQPENDG